MLKSLKIALALGLTAGGFGATAATAAPIQTWYGTYIWEEPLGRMGGSSPTDSIALYRTYRLLLGPAAGSTGCIVTGSGFQLNDQFKCTATPQEESVIIKFYHFGSNATARYPSGTPMFTMTRTNSGLVTQLQALQPTSRTTPFRGRLFRPTR